VHAALAGRLPKRLQHILSTIEECGRDNVVAEELHGQAARESVGAAGEAWGSSSPVSLRLLDLQLSACSGHGHAWVLDTGRRSDQFGRPRRGSVHLHPDGPLEPLLWRIAARARLLLPIGHLVRVAQRHGGHDEHALPQCHCGQRCGANPEAPPRLLDMFGCHLATRTAASCYTARHHRFNEAVTALLRRAGYSASTEKAPFKDHSSDRVTRRPAAPADTAHPRGPDAPAAPPAPEADNGDPADAHGDVAPDDAARGYRLDTLVHDVALANLQTLRLPAELLDHLDPKDDPFVTVLLDYTFTHPGVHMCTLIASRHRTRCATPTRSVTRE
jgi:hypothetical protein